VCRPSSRVPARAGSRRSTPRTPRRCRSCGGLASPGRPVTARVGGRSASGREVGPTCRPRDAAPEQAPNYLPRRLPAAPHLDDHDDRYRSAVPRVGGGAAVRSAR
jgi:hypothetical protein